MPRGKAPRYSSSSCALNPAPPTSSFPNPSRDGRLRPPRDPTTGGGAGLVSKGDTSLLDPAAQERHFAALQTKHCTLLNSLQSVTGSDVAPRANNRPQTPAQAQTDSESLLHSLRMLREALVASSRTDGFAVSAYSFAARVAVLLQHRESYLPALIRLLRYIHPQSPLSEGHLTEFAGYYVLHLACVLGDFNEAYLIRREFRAGLEAHDKSAELENVDHAVPTSTATTTTIPSSSSWATVDAILCSLVRNDYWAWSRIRCRVATNVHIRRLMDMGEHAICARAVACLSKAYFEVQTAWLEDLVGMTWADFTRTYNVVAAAGVEEAEVEAGAGGWEVTEDGQKVVVRRRKK